LKTSDVKVVSVPSVEAGVRAIIEGRADATGSVGLGMATNAELEADKGARYLPSIHRRRHCRGCRSIFHATWFR
jgi:hypothetical protein